jgi:hypothetical protein
LVARIHSSKQSATRHSNKQTLVRPSHLPAPGECPDCDVVTKVENDLLELFEQLNGYDFESICPGETTIWATVESLRTLVRAPENQAYCKELVQRNQRIIPALRTLYSNYIVSLERSIAERCTVEERAAMAREYVLSSERLALGEVQLASLCENSSIIFVGSGPMPISAMAYAKACSAKITALDCDPLAIRLSKKLIAELPEYKNSVEIIEGDATTFDFAPYTHIGIAAMAHPKAQIFEQIARTAGSDVTVICRTANGMAEFVYEPVKASSYPAFSEVARYVGPHFVQSKILKLRRTRCSAKTATSKTSLALAPQSN